jgi:hypothetical protein
MIRLNFKSLHEELQAILFEILTEKQRTDFQSRNDLDFAYSITGLARFRGNIFMQHKGIGAVFRIIPSKILTADDLGLAEGVRKMTHLKKGLVLVTGPTGSGKSTPGRHDRPINSPENISSGSPRAPGVTRTGRIEFPPRPAALARQTSRWACDLETISLAMTAAETVTWFRNPHTNSAPSRRRIIPVTGEQIRPCYPIPKSRLPAALSRRERTSRRGDHGRNRPSPT